MTETPECPETRIHGVTWIVFDAKREHVALERCPKKAKVLGVGEWFIPGGKLEGDETDVRALKREISEEWPGVDVLAVRPLPIVEGSAVPPGPRGTFLMRPFAVAVSFDRCADGTLPDVSADGVELRWAPIAEALASPVVQVRMMVAAALDSASSLGEPVSQEAPWVVWSHERSAWWRANRQGYAGSLFGAGVYSEDEAKAIEDDSHRGDVARLLVDEFERQSRAVGTGANWLRTQLAASREEAKPQNPCVVFGCECPECGASVISSASPLSEDERQDITEIEGIRDGLRKSAIHKRDAARATPDDYLRNTWNDWADEHDRRADFWQRIIARLSASAPLPEDKGSDND